MVPFELYRKKTTIYRGEHRNTHGKKIWRQKQFTLPPPCLRFNERDPGLDAPAPPLNNPFDLDLEHFAVAQRPIRHDNRVVKLAERTRPTGGEASVQNPCVAPVQMVKSKIYKYLFLNVLSTEGKQQKWREQNGIPVRYGTHFMKYRYAPSTSLNDWQGGGERVQVNKVQGIRQYVWVFKCYI